MTDSVVVEVSKFISSNAWKWGSKRTQARIIIMNKPPLLPGGVKGACCLWGPLLQAFVLFDKVTEWRLVQREPLYWLPVDGIFKKLYFLVSQEEWNVTGGVFEAFYWAMEACVAVENPNTFLSFLKTLIFWHVKVERFFKILTNCRQLSFSRHGLTHLLEASVSAAIRCCC